MPPRRSKEQRKRARRIRKLILALVALILTAALVVGGVSLVSKLVDKLGGDKPPVEEPTTDLIKEPQVVATATVGSSGDILIHRPVLRSAKVSEGVYEFDSMFKHMTPYVKAMDYAAINLEFGIGRGESDYYQPEMLFRVPASLIDTVMNTGYSLGLCANNHVSNGSSLALTAKTYAERNLDFIGLRSLTTQKRYLVKDVNGIKIGFVNYTYGAKTSNTSLVNYFSANELDAFYADMQQQMTDMKAEGAEATVLYIHWGNEYETKAGTTQTKMAQKLCEMGVDVIVGGHPHKIQPLELIKAENGNQTVCLYSMGNFLSNQTIEAMYGGTSSTTGGNDWQLGGKCQYRDVKSRYNDPNYGNHHYDCNDNGHTEDGLLFEFSFNKYDDGTVLMEGVNVLPTWCYVTKREDGQNDYSVIPLDKSVADWKSAFGIDEKDLIFAERSYDRTMALVGDGITTINGTCGLKIADYVDAYKAAQQPTTEQGAE